MSFKIFISIYLIAGQAALPPQARRKAHKTHRPTDAVEDDEEVAVDADGLPLAAYLDLCVSCSSAGKDPHPIPQPYSPAIQALLRKRYEIIMDVEGDGDPTTTEDILCGELHMLEGENDARDSLRSLGCPESVAFHELAERLGEFVEPLRTLLSGKGLKADAVYIHVLRALKHFEPDAKDLTSLDTPLPPVGFEKSASPG
jgi:hypothetical protein